MSEPTAKTEVVKPIELPIVKMEIVEGPIIKMVAQTNETDVKPEDDIPQITEVEKPLNASENVSPQIDSKTQENQHDSDAASSYYHSRIYYVGF